METKERITREMIRSLAPGESLTVKLPNYAAVQSAIVTMGQLRKIDGLKLESSYDGKEGNVLTIRRI